MNEKDLARTVVRHLNTGAEHLDRRVTDRLRTARAQALAKYDGRQAAYGYALAGQNSGAQGGRGRHASYRFWLSIAVLVASLLAVSYWQNAQQDASGPDVEDIDASVLTGDLPIHAYVDNSFTAWLKSYSEK